MIGKVTRPRIANTLAARKQRRKSASQTKSGSVLRRYFNVLSPNLDYGKDLSWQKLTTDEENFRASPFSLLLHSAEHIDGKSCPASTEDAAHHSPRAPSGCERFLRTWPRRIDQPADWNRQKARDSAGSAN